MISWAFRKGRQGFTIIELLIVIVVIAVLAAITLVAFSTIQDRARASAATSALTQTSKKLKLWQVENPAVAPDCATFISLLSAATGSNCTDNSLTSGNITYQYTPGTAGAFCITATSGTTSYKISESSQPTSGGCSGHGQGGSGAVTNLAVNPSAEVNTTGWTVNWGTSGTGTSTRMTDGGRSGAGYFRMTWSAAPTVTWGGTNYQSIPVVVGNTYSASVWVRLSTPLSMRLSLRSNTFSSGTPDMSGPNVSVPANTWTQLTATGTPVLSGVSTLAPIINRQGAGSWQPGDVADYDAMMIVGGTSLPGYADGNTLDWVWNGAPNNSTSTGPAQ